MSIQKILVSQNAPRVLTQYESVTEKFGATFEFRPFFKIEPLSSREFRAQRINVLDYTAIVFSSRHVIDAFFSLAEELRAKIPETMKYFCTTEAVAMYLQKHIVYRKRKIFFGTGTPESVVALIGPKHKGEKFLIAMSDTSTGDALSSLFQANGLEYSTGVFVKSVSQDLKDLKLQDYDMIVFYNPADVKSLQENFPDFQQGDIKMVSYGKSIVKAMEEAGLRIDVKAPSPEARIGGLHPLQIYPSARRTGRAFPHCSFCAQAPFQAGRQAQPPQAPHPRSLPPPKSPSGPRGGRTLYLHLDGSSALRGNLCRYDQPVNSHRRCIPSLKKSSSRRRCC